MTILPQEVSLATARSARWNTLLDKIQNGTDLDVLLGQLADNLRIVVPTSGTGTAGDPFPLADIQTVITSLPATGGKVIVPPGVYQGTTGLTITVPVVLEGASRYGCTIDYNGATGDAIAVSGAGHGTIIKNFIITMTGSGTGRAIYMNAVNDFELKNIRVNGNGPAAWGIQISEAFTYEVSHIYILTPGNGLLVDETDALIYGNATISNLFVSLTDSTDAGVAGIEFRSSVNLIVANYLSAQTGVAHPNTMTGLLLNGSSNIQFNLLDIEGVDIGVSSIGSASECVFIAPYVGNVTTNSFGIRDLIVRPRIEGDSSFVGSALWRQADIIGTPIFFSFSDRRYREEMYDSFWGAAIDARWSQAAGTWALLDVAGVLTGRVRGTTGATIGDQAILHFGNNRFVSRSAGALMETLIQRESSGAYDVYVGLTDGGRATANHGAYFEALTADTNWFAVSSDGSTKTRLDTGVAKNSAVRHLLIKVNETTAQLDFFIDNIFRVSKTTNLPGSGTGLAPYFEIQTQASSAKLLAIDYVRLLTGRTWS